MNSKRAATKRYVFELTNIDACFRRGALAVDVQ